MGRDQVANTSLDGDSCLPTGDVFEHFAAPRCMAIACLIGFIL